MVDVNTLLLLFFVVILGILSELYNGYYIKKHQATGNAPLVNTLLKINILLNSIMIIFYLGLLISSLTNLFHFTVATVFPILIIVIAKIGVTIYFKNKPTI